MSVILWIIIIVSTIVVLSLIGLGAYFLFRDTGSSSSPSNPPSNNPSGPPSQPPSQPPSEPQSFSSPYMVAPCPGITWDYNATYPAECSNIVTDEVTGTITGYCDPSDPNKKSVLNMAQCKDCKIAVRNGEIICNDNAINCSNYSVSVDGIDIPGNDLQSFSNVDNVWDCDEKCTELDCDFYTHNRSAQTCILKKGTPKEGTYTGFYTGINNENCPSYYILPNTTTGNAPVETREKINVVECETGCIPPECDYYEYEGATGTCNYFQAARYPDLNIDTIYPYGSLSR